MKTTRGDSDITEVKEGESIGEAAITNCKRYGVTADILVEVFPDSKLKHNGPRRFVGNDPISVGKELHAQVDEVVQQLIKEDPAADYEARKKKLVDHYNRHDINDRQFAFAVEGFALEEGARREMARIEAAIDDAMESLADVEHERWNGWMIYLFTQGAFQADGGFKINKSSTEWWKHLTETKYADLTEKSKESDRTEVRKTLAVIKAAIQKDK